MECSLTLLVRFDLIPAVELDGCLLSSIIFDRYQLHYDAILTFLRRVSPLLSFFASTFSLLIHFGAFRVKDFNDYNLVLSASDIQICILVRSEIRT